MKRSLFSRVLAVSYLTLTFGCCCCNDDPEPNPESPGKYAVLVSTDIATEDDVKYNSDFWYDLVLTYCTLIEQGFEDDNIFVLYGQGQDGLYPDAQASLLAAAQDHSSDYASYNTPFCDGEVNTITDISLWKTVNPAKDNLCNVLCCLSTGRPAKLVDGRCECFSSGNTGIGGFSVLPTTYPGSRAMIS